MLTRKTVMNDADSERMESTAELDKLMSLSPRALDKYEKELDAELEELMRLYDARVAKMDLITRYRFERRRALVNILRTRIRLDLFLKHDWMDVVCDQQRDYIKSKQKKLVSLRWYLRTGVAGGNA